MTLDANVVAFIGYCLLLILWVSLPLLPAWATYKITPDQKMGLSGPLQGLTVRAGGAFAAYLVIFILLGLGGTGRAENILGNVTTTMWTVKADVVTFDSQGNPSTLPSGFDALSVTFKPDIHRIGRGNVVLKLPGGDTRSWPLLLLQIPNYGGTEVDLTKYRLRTDDYNKVIEIQDPIVIRQFPQTRGLGVEG